jgi:uncharacterized protein (DUF885 family)
VTELDTNPGTKEKSSAFKNAEDKIELLEEFARTKHARFEVPKAFSWNWFTRWKDDRLGVTVTSKSFDFIRVDGTLRARLDAALEDCQETLAAIKNLDPKKQTELTRLKAEKADMELKLRRLAQSVYDLMIENQVYRKQLGIKQAQHQDMQKVERMRRTNG